MKKSALQPRSRKTPSGGMKMAKMILMMSLSVVSTRPFCSTANLSGDLPCGERHDGGLCVDVDDSDQASAVWDSRLMSGSESGVWCCVSFADVRMVFITFLAFVQ